MKLNSSYLRDITPAAFRVLAATEVGSRNHLIVPTRLIAQISKIGDVNKINRFISELAKINLIARVQNAKYDGYRLTYGGYDYLALHAMSNRDSIFAVGNQIGVGKESDVYVVSSSQREKRVLKIHRLGRVSFRTIKQNRDYLRGRKASNWMYLSKLSAQTEYTFMKALHEHGFPVPEPIDQSRHCVLMSLIDARPLSQVQAKDVPDPGSLYEVIVGLLLRLGRQGLIHGDFNEFNLLYSEETGHITLIDFPQLISIDHPNAEQYFERDVTCVLKYFQKRFQFVPDERPVWTDVVREGTLDEVTNASGAKGKLNKILEEAREIIIATETDDEDEEEEEDGDEDEDEDEEDDEEEEEEEDEEDEDEQGNQAGEEDKVRNPNRDTEKGSTRG